MPETTNPTHTPTPDQAQRPVVTAVDVVRFIVEITGIVTFILWGFFSWPLPWNFVFGIGAPVLAIFVWALFCSPKAVIRTHPFVAAVIELLIFAAATVCWWSMGQTWIGLAFAVVAIASGALAGHRRFS